MRTLGNILWHFPFFGFITSFVTFLIGGALVLTVVGAPIGLGLIELSKFLLTPFSKSMINGKELNDDQNKAWQSFGVIMQIIYFPFGLLLAAATVLQIAGLFISIIGIPVALVLAKSLSTYFNPVNKKCVIKEVEDELNHRKANTEIEKHLVNV